MLIRTVREHACSLAKSRNVARPWKAGMLSLFSSSIEHPGPLNPLYSHLTEDRGRLTFMAIRKDNSPSAVIERVYRERREAREVIQPDVLTPPKWMLDHPAQIEAWNSDALLIIILAAWQAGKTVVLPHWLLKQIKLRGTGDYGAFSPTYKLLARKFLPELIKVFEPYATYLKGEAKFVFTEQGNRMIHGPSWDGKPTIIQTGYAENPDSLESATLKAAALDEGGQRKVPRETYEVLKSRLMVHMGPLMVGSRPYEFNHLYELVTEWEQAVAASKPTEIQVINAASWDNPSNPRENDDYYKIIKSRMPEWQYDMKYRGVFTRPSGMIYSCFDRKTMVLPRFEQGIPLGWDIYVGVDFGGVNMAAIFGAMDEDGIIHVFECYHKGSIDYRAHASSIKRRAIGMIKKCWGGSASEDEWRNDYRRAGLQVLEPRIRGVEEGINRVFEWIAAGRLVFHNGGTEKVVEQLLRYSRDVDDEGNPLETIEKKSAQHYMDCLRYLLGSLPQPKRPELPIGKYPPEFYLQDKVS